MEPFHDIDSALGSARIDLVAESDPASPNDWKVTAQILGVGANGADVTLELQDEGSVGGNTKQHLTQSGSLTWSVTPKDSASIVVKRLDTNGCSRAHLVVNGGHSETKGIVRGCVEGPCTKPASEISMEEFLEGCSEDLPDISVELTFTYIPPAYSKVTPQTIRAVTDKNGRFEFKNVPAGSKFKVKARDKEIEGTMPDPAEVVMIPTCFYLGSPVQVTETTIQPGLVKQNL